MYYLVHAYETVYQGYHGIEEWELYKVDSREEALENATELSRGVIESFGLDDQYLEDEEADEDMRDDLIEEHLAFEVYPMKEEVGQVPQDELEDMVSFDPETLLEKYRNGGAL